MNEEYIKEYENMSLCDFADELVEPLSTVKQDLTKTIYIHYAEERDENYKLQNNWNELKKSIENDIKEYEESEFHIKEPPISIQTKINILIQMQELEKKQ